MVRVLTVNGVTDLDNAALGHVLRIVYCNKVVMSHRATLVKLFKHYDTQSIQMLFSTIFTKNIYDVFRFSQCSTYDKDLIVQLIMYIHEFIYSIYYNRFWATLLFTAQKNPMHYKYAAYMYTFTFARNTVIWLWATCKCSVY